jgi:hypothetical protein
MKKIGPDLKDFAEAEKRTGPKLTADQRQVVILMLGRWESVEDIQEFILENYNLSVSHQAVYSLQKNHSDKVWALRDEHAKNVQKLYPIANKDFRIKEISRMYNETNDKDLKQKLLMRAKQEVGDDVAAIAEALRDRGTGGTTNYNFDFRTISDDERNRIGKELSRAFGTRF